MEFVELKREEYDTFARKHIYRNFLNSVNALVLQEQYGYEICFLGVKDKGEIRCATGIVFLPAMKYFYCAYAQRGLLIDYKDKQLLKFFTNHLRDYLKSKKAIYLKIDPCVPYQEHDNDGNIVEDGFHNKEVVENLIDLGYIHQGFNIGFDFSNQVRWMVVLSLLDQNEECLLKHVDQQTRWSINKALKLGVQVRELNKDELPLFKKIMDYASSTRNFSDMDIQHYERHLEVYGENAKMMMAYLDTDAIKQRIDEQFAQEQAILNEVEESLKELPNSKKFLKKQKVQLEALDTCRARKKDVEEQEQTYGKMIPIAVAYFILYEDEVVYVSSGAYDEFRKYNGPYAIQWHMLQVAMNRGMKRYNFYGTSGIFDKSADDYGVFEFKKGFHGVVEELIGDFILPIDKIKYKAYQGIRNMKKNK